MVGITSYGAYIPLYRLGRAEIGRAWDMPAAPGEKAVANYDEDSLTMAVEAARDCLKAMNLDSIGGLFFASTTSPYRDKQTAATIAMVLGLNRESVTMDFGGSLRCGTNALRAAVDAVRSGSANNILVIASEMRLGYPAGANEISFGDGAAAVLVGNKAVIAEVEGSYSIYEELQDFWRSDKDLFVRSAEDRFIVDEGYNKVIPTAVSGALKAFNLAQIAASPSKLGYIPFTHVENACATGSEALRGACYAVDSGIVDIALAVGAEKLKDTGFMGLPQVRPIATWSYRVASDTPPAEFAMMATGYFAKHGLSVEEGKNCWHR